jgi:hypothetical protein
MSTVAATMPYYTTILILSRVYKSKIAGARSQICRLANIYIQMENCVYWNPLFAREIPAAIQTKQIFTASTFVHFPALPQHNNLSVHLLLHKQLHCNSADNCQTRTVMSNWNFALSPHRQLLTLEYHDRESNDLIFSIERVLVPIVFFFLFISGIGVNYVIWSI